MQPASKPATLRIILTWVVMVTAIVVVIILSFLGTHAFMAPRATEQTDSESSPGILHLVLYLFLGGFFLVLGVIGYLILIFTGCLTFDYRHPVWKAVKTKQYFANIVVVVALGLGGGFILCAFVSPVLTNLGMDAGMANIVPVMVVLVGFQLMQLWVLIWSPVEKRTIVHRLAAMGISSEQLAGATLVGLSNPASGITKRFAAIEEDMGALWITPQHLMFRGDVEQFDLSREQIVQVERRMDNRSTTALAGIDHAVLHVRLPDGAIRQIRLHVEGLWTMGQKKWAMDSLASAIESWHAENIG